MFLEAINSREIAEPSDFFLLCGTKYFRLILHPGELDNLPAGFLVALQAQELALFGLLQKLGESAKAVIRFVESGLTALQRLLYH